MRTLEIEIYTTWMPGKDIDQNLHEKYGETVVEIKYGDQILTHKDYFKKVQEVFYMITAANPFSNQLTTQENTLLNEELKIDLEAKGAEPIPGIGKDTSSDWLEEGWVVKGLNETILIDLAKKYQQNAIFRFDGNTQFVVNCL